MTRQQDDDRAQERFRRIFAQLAAVATYARRRGAADPDGIAAEVMAIAWQRLGDVPEDDPLPWLLGTARNLVRASYRAARRFAESDHEPAADDPRLLAATGLSPELAACLRELPPIDREALLLIAWEGLTPAQAAHVLGLRPVAFRVRLHRARRRCTALLDRSATCSIVPSEVPHGS